MRMTNTERVALHRQRKKLGLRAVPVILSQADIDFLMVHEYELSPSDLARLGGRWHSFYRIRRCLRARPPAAAAGP